MDNLEEPTLREALVFYTQRLRLGVEQSDRWLENNREHPSHASNATYNAAKRFVLEDLEKILKDNE